MEADVVGTDATPDILADSSADADVVHSVGPGKTVDWIVRLERRDIECQFRYIDKYGNINSRLSSAMRLNRDDARKLAKAISDQHRKYKAKALLYATTKKRLETP